MLIQERLFFPGYLFGYTIRNHKPSSDVFEQVTLKDCDKLRKKKPAIWKACHLHCPNLELRTDKSLCVYLLNRFLNLLNRLLI